MTKKKAIEILKNQQSETDTEMAHSIADLVLCQLLESLGYSDVVEEWEKINKWYA